MVSATSSPLLGLAALPLMYTGSSSSTSISTPSGYAPVVLDLKNQNQLGVNKLINAYLLHAAAHRCKKLLKSHGGVDRALLSFDIHADLRPAFHWNIKQLFVYVVAEYATETNPRNQIILWDKIVEASEPDDAKVLKQDNIFVKYALVDQADELRGKDVQLQLHWDHMPLTGALHQDSQGKETMSTFTLPEEYQ